VVDLDGVEVVDVAGLVGVAMGTVVLAIVVVGVEVGEVVGQETVVLEIVVDDLRKIVPAMVDLGIVGVVEGKVDLCTDVLGVVDLVDVREIAVVVVAVVVGRVDLAQVVLDVPEDVEIELVAVGSVVVDIVDVEIADVLVVG